MSTLKFANTHNMATFLSKPTESDGFEQIVDFLNAHPIKYALTVNPTIYTSCIEQFWSTVKVKTINGESQLHALVDGKKIIITESSVRRDLQLADENGIDCLPNSTIFEQLALMGPKTTAWNEFSSTMASAIICLATNQKFNFSKFIFESMVRKLDNLSGKILMYPRFVQVFLEQQLDDLSTHKRIYVAPSHTKNIFANIRRVGKGFFGRVTLLFPTMMVQNQSQMGEGSANPTDPHHTSTIIQPSTQPQNTQKTRKPRKDTQVPQSSDPTKNVTDEAVHKELGDSLVRAATNGRIDAIDADEEITLVSVQNVDEEMFDVNVLDDEEVFFAEQEVAVKDVSNVVSTTGDATTVNAATTTTATITIVVDITLAQALMEIKSTKPKEKRDKGKGILIEPTKPMKKKDLIRLDEETALKLQAEFDEEERLVWICHKKDKNEAKTDKTEHGNGKSTKN
ncbi:hypothetical protein Tco_0550329 [Tanacetum coccineum]